MASVTTGQTSTAPRRHNLFLLTELVKRDFRARYAGSLLSFVWSFIQPLWLLVLFSFVFSSVLRLKLEQYGVPTQNFGIFLFCGLLPWTAVNEGLFRASTAITDNAALVKKLHFPAEILVLAVVLGGVVHEVIAAAVFSVILAFVGELSWQSLPWLLVALPVQVALTLGLGMLLAAAQVFFRDISQILGMVLTGWFYLTPIVYPLAMVPERLAPWIEANPLTPLVGLYRKAFLGGALDFGLPLVALLASSGVLLLVGVWVFRRLAPAFVDEV